ncbi:hypothetical protein IQ06DRAFT_132860 [Phaeosphaeriaceae sp. SRC1lsM3a]|nr:hypothetical protein IQ06DRAFT_132860 [Stagonospora sp. SRC1lsM3a]
MCQHFDTTATTSVRPSRLQLTESNLRLHIAIQQRASQQIEEQSQADVFRRSKADAGEESEDEDLDTMRDIALKKAASLEALQAYGGCFVSGFLAMQDPLPWLSPAASPSPSNSSRWSFGSPRPDSDTLSRMDIEELSSERKRSWRSVRKLRGTARRSRS